MIPMFATSPSIEAPSFGSWAQPAPQITNTASVNYSSWLYSALAQVRDVEQMGQLIPGLGDLRVSARAAMRARMLLSAIELKDLPTPIVSPISGGGLSIAWLLGPKEVKFSFDADGGTMFFKVEDDEVLGDGAINVIVPNQVVEQLNWMLETPQ